MVVGVIADPVAATTEVAQQLDRDLPGLLSEQLEDSSWRVDVHREQLPPSDSRHTAMMDVAGDRMRQKAWDLVVCVTGLPLRDGRQRSWPT